MTEFEEATLAEMPTLRDRFAMVALGSIMQLPQPPGVTGLAMAVTAYEIADAMLEARKHESESAA